jgi:replicative DNA helicase
MPQSSERREVIGVDELRSLETSVLKTLCLTINTAGSELKYKILDSLSDDDFYFPVLRAVFRTLAEMHLRGDYVISSNLEEELQKSGDDLPAGFTIEQLFDGSLPSLAELNGWVSRLKERSRSGLVPTVAPPVKEPPKSAPKADATVVKPVAEMKKKIAEELRKSNPPSPPALESSSPAVSPPPAKPKPPPTPPPREKSQPSVSPSSSKLKVKAVLASEADEWSSYLEDLASKQGKTYETGFKQLDRELGGLAPGLMLLVDEDRERIVNFLKQVTDQMAASSPVRCLFLASEQPKAMLRLRTLARLAGVPVADIEKGRLKKDSAEWQRVEGAGRRAADWLRRVFVYEFQEELELPVVRELAKKLSEGPEKASSVVVLDSLEKVERKGGSLQIAASQLKALAESLECLILAATTDPTLLASKDADYASVFRLASSGQVELEVLRTGRESSTVARFRYEPQYCRFTE